MARLTSDDLAELTLARQFPPIESRGAVGVLELFRRLGPIQSQVPRSPFLTASSRLPGVTYGDVRDLFAEFRLPKTTSLRGTVHTTDRSQYAVVHAVSQHQRTAWVRQLLKVQAAVADGLTAASESHAADEWRTRADIVQHGIEWLIEHGSPEAAAAIGARVHPGVVWGHSGLLRRPKDDRWEKRTDAFHRWSGAILPDIPHRDAATALTELVRIHLRSYGPARREDLAFFAGARLGEVDAALGALGDEVVLLTGPEGPDYLDLAEPPGGGEPPSDARLLPEYDGLLVGYHGRNRLRFLSEHQLPQVWAKVNGLFSPIVLDSGRIVASWRTLTKGSRTDVEIRMLDPHPPLAEDRLAASVTATERVLDLEVSELRILPAS